MCSSGTYSRVGGRVSTRSFETDIVIRSAVLSVLRAACPTLGVLSEEGRGAPGKTKAADARTTRQRAKDRMARMIQPAEPRLQPTRSSAAGGETSPAGQQTTPLLDQHGRLTRSRWREAKPTTL